MPSPLLKDPSLEHLFTKINPSELCINLIMSIIAPALYERGLEAVHKIQDNHEELFKDISASKDKPWEQTIKTLKKWPSAASALAYVLNKKTPSHRDTADHPPWYEVLLSLGNHTDARLEVEEIQASFQYDPGCVLALCGRIFRHQCMDWTGSDRACVAHFFRHEPMERLELSTVDPDWVTIEPLMNCCHPDFVEANWSSYHKGKKAASL